MSESEPIWRRAWVVSIGLGVFGYLAKGKVAEACEPDDYLVAPSWVSCCQPSSSCSARSMR